MPSVPCVRPSHGSVQAPAKGMARRSRSSRAASATKRPTSQWPVWKPSAIGVPSAERIPPCVLRMRNSGSSRREGSQPMPAFWERPKRLPEGCVSNISAVIGSEPSGPWLCVFVSRKTVPSLSRTRSTGIEFIGSRMASRLRCSGRNVPVSQGSIPQKQYQDRRAYQRQRHQHISGPGVARNGL